MQYAAVLFPLVIAIYSRYYYDCVIVFPLSLFVELKPTEGPIARQHKIKNSGKLNRYH
jgi:hypothetical protein